MPKRRDPLIADCVIELYNDGWSLEAIRQMANVPPTTTKKIVAAARKRGEITRPKHQYGLTLEKDEEDQRMADLYNAYWSHADIADAMGYVKDTIRRRIKNLRERGLIKRDKHMSFRHLAALERYRRFLRYYHVELLSITEIAEREGIRKHTARGVLTRAQKLHPADDPILFRRNRRKEKAKLLFAEGLYKKPIAEILRVSVSTVERYLKEDNHETRK